MYTRDDPTFRNASTRNHKNHQRIVRTGRPARRIQPSHNRDAEVSKTDAGHCGDDSNNPGKAKERKHRQRSGLLLEKEKRRRLGILCFFFFFWSSSVNVRTSNDTRSTRSTSLPFHSKALQTIDTFCSNCDKWLVAANSCAMPENSYRYRLSRRIAPRAPTW